MLYPGYIASSRATNGREAPSRIRRVVSLRSPEWPAVESPSQAQGAHG
jgi:hypothetical protein